MNKQKKYLIITIVITALGLIALFIYKYINSVYKIGIPCIINELTGLYCPGCGITRMFFSLLNFELYQAFRYNVLVFVLLIMLILYIFVNIILVIQNKKLFLLNKKQYIIILIIVLLFGVLRNIELFSFLAPTLVK